MIRPPIGIVAGSGLDLHDILDCAVMNLPFDNFPGLIPSSVDGHEGAFIHGTCRDIPIIIQSGRLHFYEGLDYDTVVRPVDVLHETGVRTIVFTNAAGALDPDLQPGDLVAATSVGAWPFVGWPDRPNTLQTDFTVPECDHLGQYMWVHGPSYETPAEIAVLREMGGMVVGMSAAPEVHRAQALGMRAAVISCVTNVCGSDETINHEDVVTVAEQSSRQLRNLLAHWISAFAGKTESPD